MGGFLNAVKGGVAGLEEASGNTQGAQRLEGQIDQAKQEKANKIRMQIAPLALAAKGIQSQLPALIDPATGKPRPESQARYDELHDQLSDIIHKQRMILLPPPKEDPHGLGHLMHTATDKLHITRDAVAKAREASKQKVADYNKESDAQVKETMQGVVPRVNPDQQKIADAQAAGASSEELNAMRNPLTQSAKTDQDKFINDYLQRNKGKTREDAVRAWTDATTKDTSQNKPDAPLEAGGVPYGVRLSGQEYLPSQLGPNGSAPTQAKELWNTIQTAKKAKQDEADAKEDARSERQARTIAAGFERQGRQQEFTELMAQYRSDLGEYRTLDTAAQNSKEIVEGLKNQYAQPGNKAVADNELQNFYTTVVQKGGRKTAAELALTLKIGSLGLNIEQALQKAATGEMPDELRKALLTGMQAVADEQAKVADAKKPELPQIGGFQGPKTVSLKASAGSAKSKGVVSIADAMKKPKYAKMSKDQVKQAITDAGYTPVD